jgi:hypothetical protein
MMKVGAGVRVGPTKGCGKSGQAQSLVRRGGDGFWRSTRSDCDLSAAFVRGRAVCGVGPFARPAFACGHVRGARGSHSHHQRAARHAARAKEQLKRPSTKRKGTGQVDADNILPEYDFSRALPNKYASSYAAGSAVVVLDPDVAAAFPSSDEANQATRAGRNHPETSLPPPGVAAQRLNGAYSIEVEIIGVSPREERFYTKPIRPTGLALVLVRRDEHHAARPPAWKASMLSRFAR